jgi:hypothetical protein
LLDSSERLDRPVILRNAASTFVQKIIKKPASVATMDATGII